MSNASTATIIESSQGVAVVKDVDRNGRAIYRVFRGGEQLVPVVSLQDAVALARIVRPRKVTCSRCGAVDVDSFPSRLGLGCLRTQGADGWFMERLFGGSREHEDVVLCPDCVKKEDE